MFGAFFPVAYFPELYFPVSELVPAPVVPTPAGSRPFPPAHRIPAIQGTVDVRLPVLVCEAVGFVTPADMAGQVAVQIEPFQAAGSGQATAAAISGQLESGLPVLSVDVHGTARLLSRKAKPAYDLDDEDAAILEYYMLTLIGK